MARTIQLTDVRVTGINLAQALNVPPEDPEYGKWFLGLHYQVIDATGATFNSGTVRFQVPARYPIGAIVQEAIDAAKTKEGLVSP